MLTAFELAYLIETLRCNIKTQIYIKYISYIVLTKKGHRLLFNTKKEL